MKKEFNGIYKLNPIIQQAIWGGYKLSPLLGEKLFVSELWEFVNIPTCSNHICDKENGLSINHLIHPSDFPIIIKILNTEDDLSIQVHPDKTELLYIIDCCDDAKIGLGLKEGALENIEEIVHDKTIGSYIQYFNVEKGSIAYIPAGIVHTYGSGIVAIEIQNNSTETYRLYDFDRIYNGEKRKLHVNQAIKVLRNNSVQADVYCRKENIDSKFKLLFPCDMFDVYKISIHNESIKLLKQNIYCSLVCVKGTGHVNDYSIKELDSLFVMPESDFIQLNSDSDLEVILTTKHMGEAVRQV